MVDYSRFDHIGSDSEDDNDGATPNASRRTATSGPRPPATAAGLSASGLDSARNRTPITPQASAPAGGDTGAGSSHGNEYVLGQSREPALSGKGRGGGGGGGGAAATASALQSGLLPQPMMMTASKKGKEGRIKFEHEGRTVYEWEQSLEEVNLYIETPPGMRAEHIDCKITPRHIRLGLKGNPPFIDEDTGGPVVVEESYWMMDGGELNVNLQKMKKADTWPAALQGRDTQVDPVTLEGMQKKIMLERFQNENPGFDFSGAEFNGQVPDARTFMGGVKYT